MNSRHEPFSFESAEGLLKKANELGVLIPFQDDISPLFQKISVGQKNIPNRLAVQPMEGCDAEPDGSPSELTFRRYQRYAEGGSGLIWFEATSVEPEGRSNPRQLMLSPESLDGFKRLVENTRKASRQVFGSLSDVFLVLQLTHSGRYCKPQGKPAPLAACLNPYLDRKGVSISVLSDSDLDCLQDRYAEAASLAGEAGFDAVDVKACNGYLLNDLLAAFTRKKSRYGESFENRTRFLTEVAERVRSEAGGISLACRLSAYDGIPYPYGFGVSRNEHLAVDLVEPEALVSRLRELGCTLFNITIGNPHLLPHLGRPFDRALPSASQPEEHPLEGISRLLGITGKLQKAFPDLVMVGTGYSWLRQFLPQVGAAVLARGEARLVGLGRSSFAYPDAPRDLMTRGALDPGKTCISCSRCTELLRAGYVTGCVMKGRDIYGKEYNKLTLKPAGWGEEQ